MANRLASEKSPYLLQHAHNPVDWYPWGPEALETARREDKPILVSIGYSACHWCHVMERESFEDEAIARLMNDRFVSIKVDREERPDVDAIYMEAVQALTGQGGWPLNVFLTPDGRPFYGGTYFPPRPAPGMASWPQVLESVAEAYRQRKGDILHNAGVLTDYIERAQRLAQSSEIPAEDVLRRAYQLAAGQFDWRRGGFGDAPKFPQPLALELILRMWHRMDDDRARRFAELTARRMGEGGIFDQLGGGFHRYSVDSSWVVPHFEKMLYDNALLARHYLHLYQVSADPWYRSIVEQTLDYLLRDMRSPTSAFYSAEDADSEGEEGKYYVWTPEEIEQAVGAERAEIVCLRYGVTAGGNFEGKTILTASMSLADIAARLDRGLDWVEQALTEARRELLTARRARVPPGKDTKILTSWNALAIRALAEAGRALDRPDYLRAACAASDFILDTLRPEGRLLRSYRDGPSAISGFLEDYAYLAEALLTLYEAAFDPRYLHQARLLLDEAVERFWDADAGAFFDVAADAADLIVRPRGLFDNPIPSGNAAVSFALLRLRALTGDAKYDDQALSAFRAARDLMERAPLGFSYLLSALDFHLSAQVQIAIAGDPDAAATDALVRVVSGRYLPNAVLAVGTEGSSPLLEGRRELDGRATAYVCRHFACQMPVTDPGDLAEQLSASRGS
ncbi:MAG: thioredoxin domain-containing protein [Chloroflexi bacterium]|nr:thioredoxin domain-containing protein [Chloroflexota bacterium]